jgi:Co/Zn/Cd efflux system component
MADSCCGAGAGKTALNDPRWRRVLWIALLLNAAMFLIEFGAGSAADSRALQADALDFLGDAANYAISLGVAGMALAWRARAALVKGFSILAFGLWVLGSAIWAFLAGTAPEPLAMGVVGTLALIVNVAVALMLYRYRSGDANMRSVWICSRNDAIGNIAVLFAALGVLGTGSALPDLIVAALMATLGIVGGCQILRQALAELRDERRSAGA